MVESRLPTSVNTVHLWQTSQIQRAWYWHFFLSLICLVCHISTCLHESQITQFGSCSSYCSSSSSSSSSSSATTTTTTITTTRTYWKLTERHYIRSTTFDRGTFDPRTVDRATFDRRLIDRQDIRPPPNIGSCVPASLHGNVAVWRRWRFILSFLLSNRGKQKLSENVAWSTVLRLNVPRSNGGSQMSWTHYIVNH